MEDIIKYFSHDSSVFCILPVKICIVLSMSMNGSAETEACGPEEFTCRGKPGECVPLTWMCDDNPDCSDGSDEKACSKGFKSLLLIH